MANIKAQRDKVLQGIEPLREHVFKAQDPAEDLLKYASGSSHWDEKNFIEYIIRSELAVNDVIRYLYCRSERPLLPEVAIVRANIEARRHEMLALPLDCFSPWHLYSVEKYLFSLSALDLALDGILNTGPLDSLWKALTIHCEKQKCPMTWKECRRRDAPNSTLALGLIGRVLVGDGQAVIDFMRTCSERRKVNVEPEDFEGMIMKIAYHAAMRQMKQGDQESSLHGERSHVAFLTWYWLNTWLEDVPPVRFTVMFMLWAAIRNAEGEPLDPDAILQSMKPAAVGKLLLEYLD